VVILGGTLTYDSQKRFKTANESVISLAGEFPKCKGLYPDCPEVPSLTNSMCRTCPKTDGMKKPKPNEDGTFDEDKKETKQEYKEEQKEPVEEETAQEPIEEKVEEETSNSSEKETE